MAPALLSHGNGTTALTNGHYPDHTPSQAMSHMRRNQDGRPWIVQKFGGTSVGKVPDVIAEEIVGQWLEDHRIAVVCSARSSHTKLKGTTNRLLRAAKAAEKRQPNECKDIVNIIREDHINEAEKYIKSPEILSTLSTTIEEECKDLAVFLEAAQMIGEVSSGTLDTAVSKGEILACHFMAALLRDRGVDAQMVDLSDVVKPRTVHQLDQSFYTDLTAVLAAKVEACGQSVPVITGYFGKVYGGLLEGRIGRGYTDLCAGLVAVGLNAEELQIWKEVDGIFTADPSKVPTARLLSTISAAEAGELTFQGSEVLHHFTLKETIRAGVSTRIRNTTKLHNKGTLVIPGTNPSTIQSFGQRPDGPTAATIKKDILILNLQPSDDMLLYRFVPKVFATLYKWRLPFRMISTSEVSFSIAICSNSPLVSGVGNDTMEAGLKGAFEELSQYAIVDPIDGMVILSLVGKMKNMAGVAGKMFTVLGENRISIEMISQSVNEINISCVIKERDADLAINVVHKAFFE